MLSEQNAINEYASNVIKHWQSWSKGYSYRSSRIDDLHKEVSRIGKKYGLPETRTGSSTIGFDSNQWQINTGPSSYNMDTNLALDMFLGEAKIVYLLVCYAEQCWLTVVERVRNSTKGGQRPDFLGLNRALKVSYSVLDKAFEVAQKPVINTSNSSANYASVEGLLHNALISELSSVKSGTVNPTQIVPVVHSPASPQPSPPARPIPVVHNPTPPPTQPIAVVHNPAPIKSIPPLKFKVTPLIDPQKLPKITKKKEVESPPPVLPQFPKGILDPLFFTPPSLVSSNHILGTHADAYAPWPQYTMIDLVCVSNYVCDVMSCWDRWKKGDGSIYDRVFELHRIVSEIHTKCGIPKTTLVPYSADPSSHGAFTAQRWEIRLNRTIVSDYKLSPVDFLLLAETAYHEARHAEQAWIVAVEWCFSVRTKNSRGVFEISDRLLRELYREDFNFDIRFDILEKAAKVACDRPEIPATLSGEPLLQRQDFVELVQKWYHTFFGDEVKNVIKIYDNMKRYPGSDFYFRQYRNLPEELDARATQELVRHLHARMRDFDTNDFRGLGSLELKFLNRDRLVKKSDGTFFFSFSPGSNLGLTDFPNMK